MGGSSRRPRILSAVLALSREGIDRWKLCSCIGLILLDLKRKTEQEMEFAPMTKVCLCPDCDHEIHLISKPKIGMRLICACCNTVLRVIKSDPLKLDWEFVEPLEGARRTFVESTCSEG